MSIGVLIFLLFLTAGISYYEANITHPETGFHSLVTGSHPMPSLQMKTMHTKSGDMTDGQAKRISLTGLEKNQCSVNTADSTLGLGILDPQFPLDKAVSTAFIFKCLGPESRVDFYIGDNVNLSDVEGRMRHTDMPDSYLPYTLSVDRTQSDVEGGVNQILNVSVKVKGENYRDLYAGTYSDIIYISVTP